jgi:16S rRNA (adenine1518-N6/adenine1519-N6)-dimethyltransferase
MRAGVEKEGREEKSLFRIIRAAFGKRRKTLRNSLKGVVGQEKLNAFFKEFCIDCDIRPERLSLKDFINLLETKA